MLPPDFPLHMCFLAALLALAAVRVWYWRQQRELMGITFAAQQRVLSDARQIGAIVGFVLVILHLANPRILDWTEFPLLTSIRWVGAVMAAGAVAMCVKAARDEIAALRDVDQQRFVPRGLFRLVRHPIEDGLIVLAVALTLLSADWIVALLAGGLALHGVLVRAPRVERQRMASAGDAYASYAADTPAFVPRWRV